jgi:hypothetical protein
LVSCYEWAALIRQAICLTASSPSAETSIANPCHPVQVGTASWNAHDNAIPTGGSDEFVFHEAVIARTAPHDVTADFTPGDTVVLDGYGVAVATKALSGVAFGDDPPRSRGPRSLPVSLTGHVISS